MIRPPPPLSGLSYDFSQPTLVPEFTRPSHASGLLVLRTLNRAAGNGAMTHGGVGSSPENKKPPSAEANEGEDSGCRLMDP